MGAPSKNIIIALIKIQKPNAGEMDVPRKVNHVLCISHTQVPKLNLGMQMSVRSHNWKLRHFLRVHIVPVFHSARFECERRQGNYECRLFRWK